MLIGLVFVYHSFNPAYAAFFPQCPFWKLTGFQCPGCGSQRAIHALLHFDVASAFGYNPLLVISLPLMAIGLTLDALKSKNELLTSLHQKFFGQTVVYSSLIGIIAFWILRNI